MNQVGITTPIEYNLNFKVPLLRHCKSFLSSDFYGRSATVIYKNDVFQCSPQLAKKELSCFKIAAKIICWVTGILPLLAWIGAKIFHARNALIWKQPTPLIEPQLPNKAPIGLKLKDEFEGIDFKSMINGNSFDADADGFDRITSSFKKQPLKLHSSEEINWPTDSTLTGWTKLAKRWLEQNLSSPFSGKTQRNIIEQCKQLIAWVIEAKNKGEPLYVKNYSLFDRRIIVTPAGMCLKVENKKAQEDRLLGKGSFKNATFAVDIFTGKEYATVSMCINSDKEGFLAAQEEIGNLHSLQNIPQIVKLVCRIEYDSKKTINVTSKESGKAEEVAKKKIRLVLEFCGLDLRQIEKEKIPFKERRKIALQIFQGMAQLHKKHLHRDFKLENICLQEDGTIKFIDLSSICEIDDETVKDQIRTTSWYASPEYAKIMFQGLLYEKIEDIVKRHKTTWSSVEKEKLESEYHSLMAQYDLLSNDLAKGKYLLKDVTTTHHDIWSVGCVLYELYYPRLPWATSPKDFEVFESLSNLKESPNVVIPQDPFMQNLIQQLLNLDPVKRPSAEELAKLLQAEIERSEEEELLAQVTNAIQDNKCVLTRQESGQC